MKRLLVTVNLLALMTGAAAHAERGFGIASSDRHTLNNSVPDRDSLPDVLAAAHVDLTAQHLVNEASRRFALHQLPTTVKEWQTYSATLRKQIIQKAGVVINHDLPLDIKETGNIALKDYSIKKIAFQTRPGMYGTANLYVPEGKGPFPAVVIMHGHWKGGHTHELFQSVATSFVLGGYVSLVIDAFGGGERTSIHGEDEYHGNNLGASCMNIGESLMGIQISDNIRGVDLLSSLPYVDKLNIGATGASGGGNQTMWLAAVDERIKAAVPVVSVGTFETYVMKDNCICELLVDGLNLSEESGILALVAPRAIKLCNHEKDVIPTFAPAEMLRSFNNAQPIFKMLGVENNIAYQLFDLPHTYDVQDREAVLGWFDLHLKKIGSGAPAKEKPFQLLPPEQLMVFPKGERDPRVLNIEQYCKKRGEELRMPLLNAKSFNVPQKRKELSEILRTGNKTTIRKVHRFSTTDKWEKYALEMSHDKLIPLLVKTPSDPAKGYVLFCDSKGKKNIPESLIDEAIQKGSGVAVIELSGTGENGTSGDAYDMEWAFHTLSRSNLWLGKSVIGEWANELTAAVGFLNTAAPKSGPVTIDGSRTAGLAALFMTATQANENGGLKNISGVILREAPVSYAFDNRETVDFYTMAVHLPRFLNWGDVSLAAALTGRQVSFIDPRTMSGRALNNDERSRVQSEFDRVSAVCKLSGRTVFK